MSYTNIPDELKALNQWVVWGVDSDKPKIPYTPATLKPAKAGIPSTWGSFNQAEGRVRTGKAQGVGFEFNDNGIYGVDLDHVLKDGELTPEATEVVAMLNSYTEISPSGTGLHILVRATDVKLDTNRKGFTEIYNKGRYFTVTGNVYCGLGELRESTERLQGIYDKYLKPPAERRAPKYTGSYTDREYLKRGYERDSTFKALWNGSRPNGNESVDDMALMNKLAYWCNVNASLM